jgi:hypothetical protein
MIHEVGKSLSQLIPKFPPTTEAEVDALMDMKIRVSANLAHLLHIQYLVFLVHLV